LMADAHPQNFLEPMVSAMKTLKRFEPRVELSWIINLYTHNGILPADQELTLQHLVEAVSSSRSAIPQVVVRVAPDDLEPISRRLAGLRGFRIALLGGDSHQRRLPFLRDILSPPSLPDDPAVADGADGTGLPAYAIYANADICIPAWFFDFIAQQIAQARYGQATGYQPGWLPPEALVINRRDLVQPAAGTDDAPTSPRFDWHPGYDLFVFPRALMPQLVLGDVSVGLPPVGALMTLNLLVLCRRVCLIDDLFISWHHGSDRRWESPEHQAAIAANTEAAARAFRQLTDHNPAVLQRLPFLGFERQLAQWSYQSLAERFRRGLQAPPH